MLSWQVSLSGNPERYFKPMKIFLIEIAKFLPFGKNFCHLQMWKNIPVTFGLKPFLCHIEEQKKIHSQMAKIFAILKWKKYFPFWNGKNLPLQIEEPLFIIEKISSVQHSLPPSMGFPYYQMWSVYFRD